MEKVVQSEEKVQGLQNIGNSLQFICAAGVHVGETKDCIKFHHSQFSLLGPLEH